MGPGGGYCPANCFHGGAHARQVPDHLRLDADVPVPHAVLVHIDARQRPVKPRAYASEHGVVVRVHRRPGFFLPEFPQRGRAVGNHEAPTRVGGLGGEVVSQIRAAHFRERLHQVLDPDEAGGDVGVVKVDDVIGEIPREMSAMFRGSQVQVQSHRVGRLSAVGVLPFG